MSNTVPDGWAQHRQGEIADFSNGRAYKLTEWEKEGTPVIRLQNLTGSGNEFYYSNLELPERQYCQSGDLLYMWSATFGPHIWKGPKAIYHYHIWKVTPDEINLTKPYLYQLLGYKTDEWLNKSNGMGILHVTKGNMEDLQLNLPPLPEQKKIAAILTSVDTVIEKTQAQIDKLKDLKTGMMQELLTKGIGHTEFKDSPVGRIPVEWEIHQQGDKADFSNGRAYKLSEWEKEGTPVIRLQNLTGSGKDYYYSNLELPERQYCKNGDLLYMWSATFGPHIWKGSKAIYHYHIWKVTPDETTLTKSYLYYLLDYKTKQWKDESSNGMGILHVTKSAMESMLIAIPPIKEQQYISKTLEAIDKRINLSEEKFQLLKNTKKALMQDLLTGKVRVKV